MELWECPECQSIIKEYSIAALHYSTIDHIKRYHNDDQTLSDERLTHADLVFLKTNHIIWVVPPDYPEWQAHNIGV